MSILTLSQTEFAAEYARILTENGLTEFTADAFAEKFYRLTEFLLEKNTVMNLTAITSPSEIILKHYADSLAAAKYIQRGKTLADVGCGAGFPSLPLAIARPDLHILALDATSKKINFVRAAAERLSLSNLSAVVGRAEDFGAGMLRGKYDYVTARAVARLNILCECCIPLLKIGGVFLTMKAKTGAEELIEAKNAIAALRAKILFSTEFSLTDTKSPEPPLCRMIAGIEKCGETEKIYPRNYAQIKKKPL